jgi:hypothetical protein
MPAQAGIQSLFHGFSTFAEETWIPASAGMTEGESTSSRQFQNPSLRAEGCSVFSEEKRHGETCRN